MVRSLYARLDQRFGVRPPAVERQREVSDRIANVSARLSTEISFAATKAAKDVHVAIVGAGFAGLMAGDILSRSFKVSVFEARDRVGGRVWTQVDRSSYRAVEAGAELIGYNHPTWLSLAKRFDLGLTVLTTEEAFASLTMEMPLYLDGKLLTSDDAEQIYREMNDAFTGLCSEAAKIPDPYKCWTVVALSTT
jgi:monoamine oxidase